MESGTGSNATQEGDTGICPEVKVSTTKEQNALPVLEMLRSYLASLGISPV